jgi:retron-type reverse transcriptase
MTGNSSIDLSVTNIWRAWTNFRREKKPSRAIRTFETDLERNLLRLCADLHSGCYQHGPYDHKIINEKKRRDIAVAQVRDRVVHRLLYDYLVPLADRRLDFDVWSCRRGKGLHTALDRTQTLMTAHAGTWLWRGDVEKFFDHVNHRALKTCLRRLVNDQAALALLDEIIDSYSVTEQVGIPIGNLTSQIFANIYLHELDRFVRHTVKPLAYVRYGDDFVLFMPSEEAANIAQRLTTNWLLEELGLRVHARNNWVFRARFGLHFLGHAIYPSSPIAVERAMRTKINQRLTARNAVSYQTLRLPAKDRKQAPWHMLALLARTSRAEN